MTTRTTSCKEAAVYESAVKLHLEEPSHTTLKWNSADLGNVAAQFEGFLKCMAATGQMINVTMLTRALRAYFKSSPDECKAFAQKMAAALSHCRSKGKGCNMAGGEKLGPQVLAIIAAMKEARPAGLQPGSSSATLDVSSSADEDAAAQAPTTPETGAVLLKRMQEQWGEPSDGPARSIVMDSPISIASSLSPEAPKNSAASSSMPADPPTVYEPPKPPQVPRRGELSRTRQLTRCLNKV